MIKIQSWGWPSILQEDCIQKNISFWGINISLRLIDVVNIVRELSTEPIDRGLFHRRMAAHIPVA
jgi:hypothetical protein